MSAKLPVGPVDPDKRYPLIVNGQETGFWVTGAVALDEDALRVVVGQIRQEQTERHRKGLCVFCGLSLRECWCGEDERDEYRPGADGSDEVGVA